VISEVAKNSTVGELLYMQRTRVPSCEVGNGEGMLGEFGAGYHSSRLPQALFCAH